jgi:two-component system, chemotaxis family, chemotaxis protein CheY
MLEPAQSLETGGDNSAIRAAPPPDASRLLVIDDDNLHRMIICRAAAKAGYLPAGAATYEEAVRLTRDGVFGCITLDLSLGAHAGVEMLHHLRSIGCKTPIIVISGCDGVTCGESLKVAKSLELNIWQSMSKPVDLAVLRLWFEQLRSARKIAAVAAA